jgi:hypothetical protein
MKEAREMTSGELKTWLKARLQMKGSAAADIGMRRDEAPYELPLQFWKSGDDEFRSRFRQAVMDLVSEAAAEPWEPRHFNDLALLIEAAALWESVRPLEEIAQSRDLLKHRLGPQLHMLALRTLLALGWKGTPDFWLAQRILVGERWPAIIFEGLANHDVNMAFEHLPTLAASREAMRDILNLFPGLMRYLKLDISTLREKSAEAIAMLNPEAAEVMREWFRLRNYKLSGPAKAIHVSLGQALRRMLGGDSEPRAYTPMLCTTSARGCVVA